MACWHMRFQRRPCTKWVLTVCLVFTFVRHWAQQAGPRNLFELIGRCFSIAEAKLCEQWKKDANFVFELDVDGFDCFDRAKELIAKGEQAARAALPKLRRLLNLEERKVDLEIAASAPGFFAM